MVVSFVFFPINQVQAIGYSGIGGRPVNSNPEIPNSESWFIYQLDVGKVLEDGLLVVNSTSEEIKVLVYPADSIPSSDGGYALKQRVEPMFGVGSWISLYSEIPSDIPEDVATVFYENLIESNSILGYCRPLDIPEEFGSIPVYHKDRLGRNLNLEESAYLESLVEWCEGKKELEFIISPNSVELIPFIMRIPDSVDVGEHTGGLMIEKQPKDSEDNTSGIRLTTRVGVRVYQTVPGEITQDLNIQDLNIKFQDGKGVYIIATSLENLGNTSVGVDVRIQIKDKLFNKNNWLEKKSSQVLRDDILILNFEWPKPFFGRFEIDAEISYLDLDGNTQFLSSNPLFMWVVPWFTLIALIIVVILIVTVMALYIKTKKQLMNTSGWVKYRVKSGENLEDIACKCEVTWKRLAMINHISKPYTLKDGQTVLVPRKPSQVVTKVKKVSGKVKSNLKTEKLAKVEEISSKQVLGYGQNMFRTKIILGLVIGIIIIALFIIFLPINSRPPVETSDFVLDVNHESLAVDVLLDEEFDFRAATSTEEVMVEEESLEVIDPREVVVQVLNGSGTSGLAGKLSENLRGVGYVIDYVGNADRFDYDNTFIYYRSGDEDKVILLETKLVELGYEVVLNKRNDLGEVLTVVIGSSRGKN